ncbi:hypothetical protein ACET3Z_031934 [Daucus carota]
MKENEQNFSDSSCDLPCRRHPNASSVGICAYCLKDRLLKLVCPDCGEQRLSSCSCSEVSSYRNSCSAVEVGSVGRISFLIESERFEDCPEIRSHVKVLKRSSSCCVEAKKSSGFWKIGHFFRKNRGKQSKNGEVYEVKPGISMVDCEGISRSKSLCSFRRSSFNDPDQESAEFALSSAKVSDVNEAAEPRKSSFLRRILFEAKNMRNHKEMRCGGESLGAKQCVLKDDLSEVDDDGSEFIDLNLGLSRSSKTEDSVPVSNHFDSVEDRLFGHGGSCRITVNDKEVRIGSKGKKVWGWILSHQHQHGWRSSSKKDATQILNV